MLGLPVLDLRPARVITRVILTGTAPIFCSDILLDPIDCILIAQYPPEFTS